MSKSWEEMTKKQRRVAIAKDVIRHINTSNILAQNGYIHVPYRDGQVVSS